MTKNEQDEKDVNDIMRILLSKINEVKNKREIFIQLVKRLYTSPISSYIASLDLVTCLRETFASNGMNMDAIDNVLSSSPVSELLYSKSEEKYKEKPC